MFRPNRIGTPIIHNLTDTILTAAWVPNANAAFGSNNGNAINANPIADFGRTRILWAGAAPIVIAANTKYALMQQFTVTEPLAGDTVGIELNASLHLKAPASSLIQPMFMRCTAAAVATWGNLVNSSGNTNLAKGIVESVNVDDLIHRSHHYQTQVVLNADTVAGTYAHGFLIVDNSGANANLEWLDISASVRQLNDQQNINYRDTLR